ncbi:hypothetical protein Tco_1375874 [Tanacetum coccineum]
MYHYPTRNDEVIIMSGDDLIQTTVQEATIDPDEPRTGPTPITQDAGGPSDTISEPDLDDPVMQFVVYNFDRMNAMCKAFMLGLKRLQGFLELLLLSTAGTKVYAAELQLLEDLLLTNDVNTAIPAYEVSTASPNVNVASPQVSTASFSDNVVYAFMVENPNGSNLLQQDLEQIMRLI